MGEQGGGCGQLTQKSEKWRAPFNIVSRIILATFIYIHVHSRANI